MEGFAFALLAAVGFAASGVFTRLAGRGIGVPTGTALSVLASLALAVIPALVLDLPAFAKISIAGFLWIALLAFINYPLARMLNFFAITRIGAARASPLFSSSPLWATVLAIIFLGERPHWVVIVGTLCIVAGAIIIVTERRERAAQATSRPTGSGEGRISVGPR